MSWLRVVVLFDALLAACVQAANAQTTAPLLQLRAEEQADDAGLANLDSAEALWRAKAPDSYEFTIKVSCFCFVQGRPTLRVIHGQPVGLFDLPLAGPWPMNWFNTIEKVFAAIRAKMRQGRLRNSVIYDEEFGYPRTASLDPTRGKDDELGIEVTNFHAIAAPKPGPALPVPANAGR